MIWRYREGDALRPGFNVGWLNGPTLVLFVPSWRGLSRALRFRIRFRLKKPALILHYVRFGSVDGWRYSGPPVQVDWYRQWEWR